MNHDRAHRPDQSQGGDPTGSDPHAPVAYPMGGSLPDIRAQGAGTYFLGRYRIVDEIGLGGMASVHLARMDGPGGFQKWVAIKKIHPHLVEDDSFVQMFLDEARVAARISHPNVATVFDLGKHDDTYWIAMEYLHGEPLREVMRRTEELGTAMPPEIACRVIADAAEGLHAAHELLGRAGEKLGLVHRDVTPHNLFVTYDGVTKVVDFGIAKFSSRMSHTRAGTLKGKLAYMSPEQVHGEGIDRRTDIFALGVVLWELTTGQRLFRMESDLDTLAKVQECNVPRPSTLIRGYPVDLEKIVMKALAKNRGERFRTAREFSRALQSLLMRRGLFIASDEVSAYTQSIFNERIQKREAHLRWASEVTSTINVEQLLSKPKLGPEFTNSDVQAQKPVGPRPAAGMPALDREEEPREASARPRAPVSAGPPRPAAGMPPASSPRPEAYAPVREDEDDHPADGDGPTIQALPPMLEAHFGPSLGPSLPPSLSYANPLAAHNDIPTVMEAANARGRAPMATSNSVTGSVTGTAPATDTGEIEAIEPDAMDDEDQDQTVVATTRAEPSPLQAPPMFPTGPGRSNAPSPSSSPVLQPARTTSRSPAAPPPLGRNAFGQGPPSMPPQNGFPPPHGSFGGMRPDQASGEISFAETMGMGSAPQNPELRQVSSSAFAPMPTGPSELNPRASARVAPTMNRLNAPTYDNRTMTAQRFKRRPPMWVVAALSCSVALLIAGVVIAILSSASPAAPTSRPATATSAASAAGGPFTSARAAFNGVAGSQQGSSLPSPVITAPAPAAEPSGPEPRAGDARTASEPAAPTSAAA
ncbi:MAG: serine/threonine protein kinase, partial [Labilithrix sp.]|nr:serine/threonine protein kinase [Labilithrix sp.]